MRRLGTLAAALAAVMGLAALAACSQAAKPTPYANPQWGFGITFPAQPKVTETQASATQTHNLLARADVNGQDFSVAVIDASTAEGLPSEILDRAQKVLADSQELDVGSNTPVPLGDSAITGREVRFDKDGKPVMLSHLFMINGMLYEVNATLLDKGAADPAVKSFLGSFHLVAGPALPETPTGAAPTNAAPANAAATNAASANATNAAP